MKIIAEGDRNAALQLNLFTNNFTEGEYNF